MAVTQVPYPVDPTNLFGRHFGSREPSNLPATARVASARHAGYVPAYRIARQVAQWLGIEPFEFTVAVLSLAENESGGTLGRPANVWPRATAWGMFQFNNGAWRRLARDLRYASPTDVTRRFIDRPAEWEERARAVDATPWQEVALPILHYGGIYRKAREQGANPRNAARAIRAMHSGPARLGNFRDAGFTDQAWYAMPRLTAEWAARRGSGSAWESDKPADIDADLSRWARRVSSGEIPGRDLWS